MAKPDLNDGWTPIAHELLAALLCAKIPHEARVVLTLVLLQSYGPAKRKEATLDAPYIAKLTGLKRQNVWRGISFLVDSHMIEPRPGGGYRFRKDYSEWGGPSGLLAPALASFAAAAPALAWSFKGPKSDASRIAPGPATEPGTPPKQRIHIDSQSESPDGSRESVSILSENQYGFSDDPSHPCIGIGDLETKGSSSGPTPETPRNPNPNPVAVIPSTIPGPGDPAHEPPYPGENDLLEIGRGAHDLTDSEARGLWSLVWRLIGSSRACRDFYERQRFHSPAVWRAAVREAALRSTPVRSVRYLETIAGDVEIGRIPLAAPAPVKASGSAASGRSASRPNRMTDEQKASFKKG